MINGIGVHFLMDRRYIDFIRNNRVLQYIALVEAKVGCRMKAIPFDMRLNDESVSWLKKSNFHEYPVSAGDVEELKKAGFKYIVVHKEYLSDFSKRLDTFRYEYVRSLLTLKLGKPNIFDEASVFEIK